MVKTRCSVIFCFLYLIGNVFFAQLPPTFMHMTCRGFETRHCPTWPNEIKKTKLYTCTSPAAGINFLLGAGRSADRNLFSLVSVSSQNLYYRTSHNSRSWVHYQNTYFDTGTIGKLELRISTATFQLPSVCFFQISTYFPLSIVGTPLESFTVNS